ncbi:MAG: BatD family protein [Bacteroidota bacterium]
MNFTKSGILGCLSLLLFVNILTAQDIKIEYGADQIAVNQLFTITLSVENERLQNYSPFPEVDGLVKRGTSSSTSTSFINGQMTSKQSITQNYQVTREGTIVIPPFDMVVNGKTIRTEGKTIKVGPPTRQQQQNNSSPFQSDPFEEFFGRRNQPSEFVDIEANAFLALTTDKPEVYVGEGFTTTLAFYVSEENRAELRFYDLGKQITDIVKEIKPNTCWEENFNIDNISGEPITINNKAYTQYKIYQAAYYPLNKENIKFPSIGLKLIKYKVAKNPSFFGRNRQEDFETFYSKPKEVKVKDLPPHPLKNQVAIGNYQLAEKISTRTLNTGESFNYSFNIVGEGNISAIEKPIIPASADFDFYDPNTQQNITRSAGKVKGTKTFSYYGIPNEPGTYDLGDYFQWVFFNPDKEAYDTLKSRQQLVVSGESRKNEYIQSTDLGTFYNGIEFADNQLTSLEKGSFLQIFANIFALVILVLTGIIMFRK